MWHKELPLDFHKKSSGVSSLNFLWQQDNIYIMDNHLAAAFCWHNACNPDESYNFMHIDRHLDFLCNYPLEAYSQIKSIKTINDYCALQYDGQPLFQWDNYIKSMQLMYPKWFSYNVFSTPRGQVDKTIQLLVPHMCIDYIEPDKLGDSLGELFVQEDHLLYTQNKWIVNIDLDVFFNEEIIKLYDDQYIRKIASVLNENMSKIKVLTICLSPECCGRDIKDGWPNSIRALNTFCSQIEPLKNFVFPKDYK